MSDFGKAINCRCFERAINEQRVMMADECFFLLEPAQGGFLFF